VLLIDGFFAYLMRLSASETVQFPARGVGNHESEWVRIWKETVMDCTKEIPSIHSDIRGNIQKFPI
jgi:hypothetical protein